ncbi:MAG: hypothetical protein ACJAU6_000157 [Alphaproteobacteria bacterium]|jgi:hypothetical protein
MICSAIRLILFYRDHDVAIPFCVVKGAWFRNGCGRFRLFVKIRGKKRAPDKRDAHIKGKKNAPSINGTPKSKVKKTRPDKQDALKK